jgi:hypothetical protein
VVGGSHNAGFGIVTLILAGKAVATATGGWLLGAGAVELVVEHARRRECNAGRTRGTADVVSLNGSWRRLPADASVNFVAGASGVQE